MKTLVYIASGGYRSEYESLDYDRIYLVDMRASPRFHSEKVRLLRCDALDAVHYFLKHKINIDCLVTLCESRGEGGQTYAMCSDVFMGYIMPLLTKEFLWICNDTAYYDFTEYHAGKAPRLRYPGYKMHRLYGHNFVSLDLPYTMQELTDDDPDYLSPAIFSHLLNIYNRGHVFRMNYAPVMETHRLPGDVTIRLILDSAWNHYEELDHLYVSFKLEYPPMKDFFETIDRVSYYKQMDFGGKLRSAASNGYRHIGFTPHYWYQYDKNYQKQIEGFIRNLDHPMTIDFYYLNHWFDTRHIRKAVKTLQREHLSNN